MISTIRGSLSLRGILWLAALLALAGCLTACSGLGADEQAKADEAARASDADGDAGEKKDEKSGKKGKGDGDEDEDEEEPVPVEVAELTRGHIESLLRSSTNLECESHVEVHSQAARLVTELRVEEGDRVRKGQVLLRLQDEEQRNALARVGSQLDKAEREYKRQQRLFEQQLISEQAFNEATYELDQLRLAKDDAERELGYATVTAPISGTITRRLVNLGDQISLGEHLFDIVDFNSMVARIYVPEKNLLELKPGQPARITAQSLGGRQYEGRVKRIAPVVDPQSGTIKVTVAVGQRPGLRSGMYVDVDLVTATHTDALLVPKRALLYDNDQVFVYRLGEDSRVERVNVTPVLADQEFVEPRDGLNENDRIVVAGQAGLKHGALVEVIGEKNQEAEVETASVADRDDDQAGAS